MRRCPICDNSNKPIVNIKYRAPASCSLPSSYDIVFCHKCGLTYSNIWASQKIYDHYYQSQNLHFDRARVAQFKDDNLDVLPFVTKHLPLTSSIADIGCGPGTTLGTLLGMGYKNLTAYDLSWDNVKACSEKTIKSYAMMIPPEGLKYDAIFMLNSLEHVYDLQTAIGGLTAALNDEGVFYVRVPNTNEYSCGDKPFAYFNNEHINHFSLHSLKYLFRSFGYVDFYKKITVTEGWPVIHLAFMKTKKKMPLRDQSQLRFDNMKIVDYCKYSSESIRHFINPKFKKKDRRRAVIWGAGNYTQTLLGMSHLGDISLEGFVDSSLALQGRTISGAKVYSPAEVEQIKAERVVVSSFKNNAEILDQTKALFPGYRLEMI